MELRELNTLRTTRQLLLFPVGGFICAIVNEAGECTVYMKLMWRANTWTCQCFSYPFPSFLLISVFWNVPYFNLSISSSRRLSISNLKCTHAHKRHVRVIGPHSDISVKPLKCTCSIGKSLGPFRHSRKRPSGLLIDVRVAFFWCGSCIDCGWACSMCQ